MKPTEAQPRLFLHVRQMVLVSFMLSFGVAVGFAQSGALVPWTTYEAENMTVSGGSVLGPLYFPNIVESESSGRKCVQLNATGQYIQFTAQAAANSIVVRYSVPDTTNGGGANYTLSLYDNGVFVEELPVTSMYSWLYGAYPFANNPSAGSPRNFYDEVRTNNLVINPGDVIRLEKGAGDTASYYNIDLVDLENAPTFTAPSNSVSILAYGGDNTGNTNSTTALENAISAANRAGESVWMPAGIYLISSTINLPSNTTIQGAGMWQTTLVGSPALYANPSDRVTFNGEGNNIHLANFAVIGKLNYRNDNEPNDGLGGAYGTGSTISNLWIEHTKTGAWLVNSRGLVVSSCRFRDTIADGCNLNLGMQGCIITNCACRGTGDDAFADWPATYLTQVYAPGSNVFTQCTAELNFLANGGAIYGGTANAIENCLFQDITYGCGVLISSTFAVGTNNFGGTTTAQNSEINRCGGFDPNFDSWRGAFQICLQLTSISNIFVNNMNITNSVSTAFSIISPGSGVSLSNAVLTGVNIPNYGLGAGGQNGLWAESGATGRMTVSNCTVVEFLDSSAAFTFTFVTNIQPTVQSMSIVQQPPNVLQGSIITPEVQVEALDAGQTVSNAAITVSLGSGAGVLSGTLTRNTDANGIAHFNDLSVSVAGPKTLTATAAMGSSSSASSNPFMVIGTVAALAFTTQPASILAGNPFAPQPVVQTIDQYGNPTTSGLSASLPGQITLTNGNGAVVGTTSFNIGASFGDGVVSFTNLTVNTAGPNDALAASVFITAPTAPVAGAVLWLDANDPATLTANATKVSAWQNKGSGGAGSSGANLWFTQPTSSLQPWLTNQLNGKAVLTFSKNGNGYSPGCTFLANTNGLSYTNGGSQMTYFIVARQNEDSMGWQGPVSFSALGQTDGQGAAGAVILADGSQTAPYPFGIQRNHPATPMQADIAAPPVNTAFLMTFVDNAGAATLSLTNAAGLSENNSASIINGLSPYSYAITGVTVGGRLEPDPATVDNGWDGDVAEVLVYNTALSAADQTSVQAYLMNKWFGTSNMAAVANAISQAFTVLPSTPPPPNILRVTVNTGNSVTLTYGTTPGYSYQIQVTATLSPPMWTTLAGSGTNATGTIATFTDTHSSNNPCLFYRVVSP